MRHYLPMHDTQQFIHLDLKGTIPSEARLCDWLDWLSDLGFKGIVWEFDDRLPWRTWPGVHRPGYDIDAWKRILNHARKLDLQSVPLIQTFGHLEWLLKHDRYQSLREAGHYSVICPKHPDTLPKLTAWIDEVIELHSDSDIIHLGGDEVFRIATCPKCKAAADASPTGVMDVFHEHMLRVIDHVISRGKRPMIWPSMYRIHSQAGMINDLPDDTILGACDYGLDDAISWYDQAKQFGHQCWGGSAIRQGYDPIHSCLGELSNRVNNVQRWHTWAPKQDCPIVLHTTWGRSASLMPIYGPWEGWLPVFLAAGSPDRYKNSVMRQAVDIVDAGMQSHLFGPPLQAAEQLASLNAADPREQAALQWMQLALRHRHEMWWAASASFGRRGLAAVDQYMQLDPDLVALKEQERVDVNTRLDQWQTDVRSYFAQHAWSDVDEYLASRAGNLYVE